MNENTLLPGNRDCSHKFRIIPIKHPRCGQFVTLILNNLCYLLKIKHISPNIENFHQDNSTEYYDYDGNRISKSEYETNN